MVEGLGILPPRMEKKPRDMKWYLGLHWDSIEGLRTVKA